ncbi:unnamed protein product [Durusdinium trenchii]|uniref:DNA (cytosine-5-)-methyltransferase n=1 Tax=Durusdinium trenchii TaxID=1381693 RepID=A0ABP0SSB8_9DINO
MEYSKKRALEGIMSFIDAWSPRVPEPAGAPGVKRKVESFEDPTGIDKALEKAKKAATEKKEAHGESGRGPKGSVGARLERRAAERREQQRKKEEEKKKESRGRSRSRKRRPSDAAVEGSGDQSGRQQLDISTASGIDTSRKLVLREREEKSSKAGSRQPEAVKEPRAGASSPFRRSAKRDRSPRGSQGETRRVVLREAKEVRLAEGDMAEEGKGLERSQESDSGSESSEEGFEALPAKSNPEESDGDWENLSVDLEAGVEESLAIMQRWLKSEECGGLSISQTGGLLASVCMRSGTNLGEYLKRSIEPGSDDGNKGRKGEVLPLPLWADGKEQLRSLFESGDFRKFGGLRFMPPVFGVFDYLWKDISDGEVMIELGAKSVEEILMAGLREMRALEEEEDDVGGEGINLDAPQSVLVFDFFAGIGGLSRALELAGQKVDHVVVIEKDPECRRLNKTRWPGCDVITDITRVTKGEIEKYMRSVPGLTGGLSKLNVNRIHLQDPRSQLFYKYVEILGWIEDLAREMKVWSVLMVGNVVGDEEDIREMKFNEELEPLGSVCDEGWFWAAAEVNKNLRLPTFTRAIPRRNPPKEPAGLQSCDRSTIDRWKEDRMKFPPYTYRPEFLFHHATGEEVKRVASATKRERLMGYPTGYTLALFRKEAETEEEKRKQTVAREAAIGNSFHTVVVACLMDLWLWKKQA